MMALKRKAEEKNLLSAPFSKKVKGSSTLPLKKLLRAQSKAGKDKTERKQPLDNKLVSSTGNPVCKSADNRTKESSNSADNIDRCETMIPDFGSSNWKQLIKSGKVKYKIPSAIKQAASGGSSTNQSGQRCPAVPTSVPATTPDIWFDDVDDIFIEPHPVTTGPMDKERSTTQPGKSLVKSDSFEGLTKVVGMDCEMVGIGYGGKESMLARVSIVNQFGQCIYDEYCRPREKVTDYRTAVSGIRPADLVNGKDFSVIQKEVNDILNGRILVGHAIRHDLKVLFLDHPHKSIRDTCKFKPFRALFSGATPSLKKLTAKLLGVQIQDGEHSSVQDAQAAMRLYTMHRKTWEATIKRNASSIAMKKKHTLKKKKTAKESCS